VKEPLRHIYLGQLDKSAIAEQNFNMERHMQLLYTKTPQHIVIWSGICGKQLDFYNHLVPLTKRTPDHPPSPSVLYKSTTPWSSSPYFCNLHMTTDLFPLTVLPLPTTALPRHAPPPLPLAHHPNHNWALLLGLFGPEDRRSMLLQSADHYYHLTKPNIPEDNDLHQHCCETLRSHVVLSHLAKWN